MLASVLTTKELRELSFLDDYARGRYSRCQFGVDQRASGGKTAILRDGEALPAQGRQLDLGARAHVSLVSGKQITPRFLLAIVDNITERKRAEEALRDAQMELAHVTRVATLGEMTASIAHEINQPLGALVNNAGACLGWLDCRKPGRSTEFGCPCDG